MTNDQMAANYYKAGLTQRGKNPKRPDYVPKRVILQSAVRSDVPWNSLKAVPGEYEVESNQWGAISVKINGESLGLKPAEFDVIEWTDNPHIIK